MMRGSFSQSAVLLTWILNTGCECRITEELAQAWQLSMSEALVPDYRNFEAIACDGDIGWYLFSYEIPAEFDAGEAIPLLHRQIDSTAPYFAVLPEDGASCWSVVKVDTTELQLRCPTVTYRSPGCDEWRIRVDPVRRKVTAMYSNLDSPVERRAYPSLLRYFKAAHLED